MSIAPLIDNVDEQVDAEFLLLIMGRLFTNINEKKIIISELLDENRDLYDLLEEKNIDISDISIELEEIKNKMKEISKDEMIKILEIIDNHITFQKEIDYLLIVNFLKKIYDCIYE